MQKKKLEQTILVILIPVFMISLLYQRFRERKTAGEGYEAVELRPRFKKDKRIDKIPKPVGVLEVRYEGGPRDPLRNLYQAYLYELKLQKEKTEAAKKVEEVILPMLNIQGLIWNTDTPQAIINGKVVKIGDTVEEVKIIDIEKAGLTIVYQGKTIFLPRK